MSKSAGMRLTVMAGVLACGVVQARPADQQIGRAPVEVSVPAPPTPIAALGRKHLVYEVHLTNFGALPVALEQIEVLNEGRVIASWNGRQLWQRVHVIGQPERPATSDVLQPGLRAVAYLWITLQADASAPGALAHRLTFADKAGDRETMTTPPLSLASPAPAIGSPVRGGPWVAVRGPANASGHRLSLVTLEGRTRVPQRFAVDWTLLGEDGLAFHGDRTDITNWYGYDAPAYAAAAGTVVLVRDGSPDRPAFAPAPPAIMEAVAAPGNVVVIDIGHGRFASYAHLKPGSVRVAQGDRVSEGQPLARIGNSGNSLGPHLHFHVSDAIEPLGGEGLPFALNSFDLVGRIGSLSELLQGTAWRSSPAQPARTVTAEMPLENMVMRFSQASAPHWISRR